ncbi:MAG TPA: YgiT-type zinc finger protein [Deltaproteobacteria bacterium]|nr:YgiT-type zinc finger protein [Deltaproteobacteria bacterium]
MICPNCDQNSAHIEKTTQSLKVFGKEEYILIQDIPVTKWDSCHETLFDAQVVKQLDEYRKNPNLAEEKPIRVARFPKVA